MTGRGRAVLALGLLVYVAAWVFGSRALYPVATGLLFSVALAVATLPPAASMIRTLRQSDRRNEILSELAKYQEHLRERAEAIRPPSEIAGVDLKQG